MKVSDILRVKGGTLYTVTPEESLATALRTMAELDIGSLVVMSHGELAGMLPEQHISGSEIAVRHHVRELRDSCRHS